jgi:Leucine-rich repeat (LRR) protein
VSGNGLTALPRALCTLRTLTELDLSHNRLSELPPQLAQLGALRRLVLDCNPLEALHPECIGELRELYALSASSLRLCVLPAQAFGRLRTLTELDLSHCQLELWLPVELARLPLLRLDVSYNDLEHLFDPDPAHRPSLLPWQKLRSLTASHCALASLPDDLGALTQLAHLDVCDNDLSELPASLGYALALTTLLATRNPSLMSLPAALLHLPLLTCVRITNCYLSLLGRSAKQVELTRGQALPSEPYQVRHATSPSTLCQLAMTAVSRLYIQRPLAPERLTPLLDRERIPSSLWERLRRERLRCAGCGWDFFGEPVV